MPAGALAAAGSLGAGLLGYFGARSAANSQADAAARQYQLYAPTATGALSTLRGLYGLDGGGGMNPAALAQFRATPGYQFALGEGLRATDFGDSSRGQLLSSNNLRNRTQFASGLADETFRGSYVNPLLSLAGLTTGGASSALGNYGAAQAGGTVGGVNALGGAISNASSIPLYLSMMNRSAYGSPGSFTTPGTAANGGWSTTTTPSSSGWGNWFS